MKKVIILIISTMILILLSENVKALSLDGTFTGESCPFTSTRRIHLQLYDDLSPRDSISFTNTINTGNNDFMVFPLQGMFLTVNGINQSQTTLTSVIPYIHVYLITNKNWTSCEFQNNELVCPTPHDAIASSLGFDMDTGTTYTNSQIDLNIQVYNCASMYKKDNSAIVEQQQETNEIINQTIEYNNETNSNTIGANETMQAGQMENQLIEENKFNGSILDGLGINADASSFIWNIVNGLRGMNIAIITLMTTALGFGIIKLVLNR